uniref:Uncharacterized protein n=1 Tax=Solanum lycopersicum TaxID=4081 RepID=A0A3Q7EGK9_SOLLC
GHWLWSVQDVSNGGTYLQMKSMKK